MARADGTSGPVDKAACLDAVSKGQRMRDTHQLVEAREKFRVCARAECPTVVQTDCVGWLAEVERTMPTVVLSAKDRGRRDVVDVRVWVDGQQLATSLDGQAVGVNPGLRTFRFERSGARTATSQVLVKEGEKARSVAVVLAGDEAAALPPEQGPPGEASGATHTADASSSSTTVRLLALMTGGLGVVGMGVSAGVAVDAKSRDSHAANEPGTLRQTDSISAVNEGNVATIVVGIGAAMAVAGLVLWIVAPSGKASGPSATVPQRGRDLMMGTDGRGVFLSGSF